MPTFFPVDQPHLDQMIDAVNEIVELWACSSGLTGLRELAAAGRYGLPR